MKKLKLARKSTALFIWHVIFPIFLIFTTASFQGCSLPRTPEFVPNSDGTFIDLIDKSDDSPAKFFEFQVDFDGDEVKRKFIQRRSLNLKEITGENADVAFRVVNKSGSYLYSRRIKIFSGCNSFRVKSNSKNIECAYIFFGDYNFMQWYSKIVIPDGINEESASKTCRVSMSSILYVNDPQGHVSYDIGGFR